MSLFDFDIDLMIKRLLPSRKRTAEHLDWIASILKGTRTAQTDLVAFRTDTLRTLSYNSQTLIFNKLLNDNCDPTLRRIYIDNSVDDLAESHCFKLSEGTFDSFAYKLSEEPFVGRYAFKILEYLIGYDFTVVVPAALTVKENTIRSLVNFYKLAGKRYLIKFF